MTHPMTIFAVNSVPQHRQPTTMILVGNPMRDPWAVMQCSCGETVRPPNVTVEFQHGDMGDDFLCFKAAADIEPFSDELVWCLPTTEGTSAAFSCYQGPPTEPGPSPLKRVRVGETGEGAAKTSGEVPGGSTHTAPPAASVAAAAMAGAVGAAVANVEGAEAKGAAPTSSEDPGPEENEDEGLAEGEVSQEVLPEGAEEIGITQRPKGSVHLCQGEIFLAFNKVAELIKANTPLPRDR